MNIEQFYFPVEQQDIALFQDTPWINQISGYKAIVTPQQDDDPKVISVVKNSYKLVPNKQLIEPFLKQVASLGVRWKIDPSHSFCQINRMRLQVTFPDILLKDDESDIPLSVYLHNSYDQSEGVRAYWGAIRGICMNGMVFGTVLGSMYARHTKGFTFDHFYEEFGHASDKINTVQNRINQLQQQPVDVSLMEDLQETLGKRRMQEIASTDSVPDISQWELLNNITYYISHQEEKPKRANLQMKASKVYGL